MHATNAGEKRKSLNKVANSLTRDAKAARNVVETLPDDGEKSRKLQTETDKLMAMVRRAREVPKASPCSQAVF